MSEGPREAEQTSARTSEREDQGADRTETATSVSGSTHGRLGDELRRLDVHLELLRGDIEARTTDEALHRVDLLTAAVARLRRLASGLEWLEQIEQHQEAPRRLPLDEPLDEALTALSDHLDSADALVVRDELPVAWVRPGDLRVVFEELLTNALRFRGDDPPVVRITAERDGDWWVVVVEDNGTGFDPDHASELFEPGIVLEGGQREPGSGVGLAACRLLLRRNYGEITVTASPGRGARVTFRVHGGAPATAAR